MDFLTNLINKPKPPQFQFHLFSFNREDIIQSDFSEKNLLIQLITYAINQIRKDYKNAQMTLTGTDQQKITIDNIVLNKVYDVIAYTDDQDKNQINCERNGNFNKIIYLMKENGDIQVNKFREGKQTEEVSLSLSSLKNLNKIHQNIDNNVQVRKKVKVGADGMTQHQFMIQGAKDKMQESNNKKTQQSVPKLQEISMTEVNQHNSIDDCWCVFANQVYDITQYMSSHPGGREILLDFGGQNIDKQVANYHAWVNVKHILKDRHLGALKKDGSVKSNQFLGMMN